MPAAGPHASHSPPPHLRTQPLPVLVRPHCNVGQMPHRLPPRALRDVPLAHGRNSLQDHLLQLRQPLLKG